MSLLHHLWDDTIAGPPPDSGLGKLRKFSVCPSSSSAAAASATAVGEGGLQVTRSIIILRAASSPSSSATSCPRSPSTPGSRGPPDSPFAHPTPMGNWKRFQRKPAPPAAAKIMQTAEPRYPTVFDWVVISALDR